MKSRSIKLIEKKLTQQFKDGRRNDRNRSLKISEKKKQWENRRKSEQRTNKKIVRIRN